MSTGDSSSEKHTHSGRQPCAHVGTCPSAVGPYRPQAMGRCTHILGGALPLVSGITVTDTRGVLYSPLALSVLTS
jgi:hypothetical protein